MWRFVLSDGILMEGGGERQIISFFTFSLHSHPLYSFFTTFCHSFSGHSAEYMTYGKG